MRQSDGRRHVGDRFFDGRHCCPQLHWFDDELQPISCGFTTVYPVQVLGHDLLNNQNGLDQISD